MATAAPRIRDGFPGQRLIVLPRPVVSAWLDDAPLLELLPSDLGHFPRAYGHYVERPSGAAQLVLLYCVGGEGWVRTEQGYRVRAGEAVVLAPGTPHAYGADDDQPWTIYWVHMAGLKARRAARLLTGTGASPVLRVGLDPGLPPLFEELLDLLAPTYTASRLAQSSAALGQLVVAFAAAASAQAGAADSVDGRMDRVIATMSRRVGDRLSVAELAAEARLSPSHFSAVFRRKTGFAPLDFFIRLKMQRACRLLDSTALPVKAIAADLGFDDPLYFSRCFRRVHECSPRQYRAASKG